MKKLTATQIKVIAIIAMTLDHIAYTFLPAGTALHYILHLVGKTTAPIMCFFLAEGFRHTHDKKKYFLRLLLFSAISQPVYYMYVYGSVPDNVLQFISSLNFLFALILAFICLLILTNEKLNFTAKGILTAITISFAQFVDWGYIIPVWTIIFFFFNKETALHLSPFVAPLLTTKGACQLLLTTKQPAQIAQTAFGYYIDYFCFLHCLLDRGRISDFL